MKKITFGKWLMVPALALGLGVNAAMAQTADLIQALVSQVGVSEAQATGGTAALFNVVKSQLGAEQFSTITDALPAVSSIMNSAGGESSGGGLLSAATSMLGGDSGGSMAALAGLATSFKDLGMSGDTVQAFIPVVTDYARENGGDAVASLIQGALQ